VTISKCLVDKEKAARGYQLPIRLFYTTREYFSTLTIFGLDSTDAVNNVCLKTYKAAKAWVEWYLNSLIFEADPKLSVHLVDVVLDVFVPVLGFRVEHLKRQNLESGINFRKGTKLCIFEMCAH